MERASKMPSSYLSDQ
ncbi:hypothetical protein [Escherichia coli]|nr:hypothetical protein [Escherichia coli]